MSGLNKSWQSLLVLSMQLLLTVTHLPMWHRFLHWLLRGWEAASIIEMQAVIGHI